MAECPVCHDIDGYVASLLKAWKEIEKLENDLKQAKESVVIIPTSQPIGRMSGAPLDLEGMFTSIGSYSEKLDTTDWRMKYNAIKEAYIKTRLEVSGSFGNWSGDTRRRVLENEISAELGFKV